jgi:hypothetical protein
MSSSDTNIIKIIKSHTKLRADQGVGRRVHFTSDAIRLETEYTSGSEIDIVSPSSNHRVSFNGGTRDSSTS